VRHDIHHPRAVWLCCPFFPDRIPDPMRMTRPDALLIHRQNVFRTQCDRRTHKDQPASETHPYTENPPIDPQSIPRLADYRHAVL
jgi:hypothetical protein